MDTDDALLLIRGERPVMDKKYNIFKHPNFARTERGGAKPYVHRPTPDYALPDLPYQFTSLDDIEIIELEESEHEHEEQQDQQGQQQGD